MVPPPGRNPSQRAPGPRSNVGREGRGEKKTVALPIVASMFSRACPQKKRLSRPCRLCSIDGRNPAPFVKHRLALLIFLLTSVFVLPSKAAPLSGTRTIGPTGDYASITAAIADVQAQTLGGPLVLELQPAYASTVETFPLVFTNLTTTAANTLTLRPQAGATGLSITSADTTAATVDLNGAQFVTIDGRPGGVGSNAGSGGGTASQLTIANTDTAGVALRFINEASNNTICYTTLQGVSTSNSSGTVVFSTTTGANGNDNNLIDHCDIGDGASTPACSLYALGSTGTTAQNNSGNTVANCNVFNFYTNSGYSTGVRLEPGNTDWSITGNSFYQTATRAATYSFAWPIILDNPSGNNFTVTGNFIGGSAPNTGGAPWTASIASVPAQFAGIYVNVGTAAPSSVQGNTIANMVWTFDTAIFALPGDWSGIYVRAGAVNIGTVTGNTIGTGTGTGSISITMSQTGGTSYGIGSASTGTVAIANNTIGSITVSGSAPTISASFTGISVTAGANTISNNIVGSLTTPNSLNAATSSTSNTGQQVTGILSSSTSGTSGRSITGNTVANLNNNYVGTASTGQLLGIVASSGVNTITGNTVRNLSTTSRTANTTAQSVVGISAISLSGSQTVSQNTVHSLANTTTSAQVSVTGIDCAGTGTNVFARNLVHSLAVSSAGSVVTGMQFGIGRFTVKNNMVRLGLKADGTSTAGASLVRGIFDNSTLGGNYYHNSVYLGGTQTSGATSTRAFDGSTGVSNTRSYQNNIFVNARSNSGATSKHYAVVYGGTGMNPAGLTANNNLFFVSGTGGVLGSFNGVDQTTLAGWQATTGVDAASLSADPLFVNPTGTAATVDLHLQPNTPANNAGVFLAGVTDDFDGQNRSHAAPDIGADEVLSSNADLSQFTLAEGALSPVFAPGTTAYTASVANAITYVSATVGTADPLASVMFSGGNNLAVGANTFSVIVTAPDGVTTKTYTVTITRQSALETWRFTYFGTTGNTGNAANAADPYHTGVPNLAVFAVLGPNQDPAKVAFGLLPQPQITGGNYVVTFSQPAGVNGVTYGAEWSADLSPGSWTPVTDTGTGGTHTFSVPIGSAPMKFVRLTVTPQ